MLLLRLQTVTLLRLLRHPLQLQQLLQQLLQLQRGKSRQCSSSSLQLAELAPRQVTTCCCSRVYTHCCKKSLHGRKSCSTPAAPCIAAAGTHAFCTLFPHGKRRVKGKVLREKKAAGGAASCSRPLPCHPDPPHIRLPSPAPSVWLLQLKKN